MDKIQNIAVLLGVAGALLTVGITAGRFEARLDAAEARLDRQSAYILQLEAYVQTLDGSNP